MSDSNPVTAGCEGGRQVTLQPPAAETVPPAGGPRPAERRHAGADWLEQNYGRRCGPISPLGRSVADLLGDLAQGLYHLDGEALAKTNWTNPVFIDIVLPYQSWATYDFDQLTQLVILCHDRCIRAEIAGASRGKTRLLFHGRQRTGGMSERHPAIEEAIKRCRDYHGGPIDPPAAAAKEAPWLALKEAFRARGALGLWTAGGKAVLAQICRLPLKTKFRGLMRPILQGPPGALVPPMREQLRRIERGEPPMDRQEVLRG